MAVSISKARTQGFTDRGIGKLIKALKGNPPVVRIGVLAGNKSRSRAIANALDRGAGAQEIKQLRNSTSLSPKGMGPTNAEIGAAHEYGAPNRGLPARSWLRAPLIDLLGKEIANRPQLAKVNFQRAAKDGTIIKFLQMIGVLAEAIVRRGFTNEGYGKWAPLSPKYAMTKTVKNTLVETTQLRESVLHVIVDKGS